MNQVAVISSLVVIGLLLIGALDVKFNVFNHEKAFHDDVEQSILPFFNSKTFRKRGGKNTKRYKNNML